MAYEMDCSNCKAVYFGESERSLKSRSDQHKWSVKNCDCEKNCGTLRWEADHNFSWDQKNVVDRENRLIPKKIKKLNILWKFLITLTKCPEQNSWNMASYFTVLTFTKIGY